MSRQLRLGPAPAQLRRARLDNLALLPGSLLSSIERYQALANELPDGGVPIVVPADNPKQKAALLVVARLLAGEGHRVRVVAAKPSTSSRPLVQSRLEFGASSLPLTTGEVCYNTRTERDGHMAHEPNHIPFDEFTRHVAQVFDQVRQANQPVLVEQNGDVFRLVLEEPRDIWKGYDPQKVKAALSASRGLFAGTDTEQFLAEMDQQREQGPTRFD